MRRKHVNNRSHYFDYIRTITLIIFIFITIYAYNYKPIYIYNMEDCYDYSVPEIVRLLGQRFKKYRLRANMTQKEVAE